MSKKNICPFICEYAIYHKDEICTIKEMKSDCEHKISALVCDGCGKELEIFNIIRVPATDGGMADLCGRCMDGFVN